MGSLFRSGAQPGGKLGEVSKPQASTTELLGASGAELGRTAESDDGNEPSGKRRKAKKAKREKKRNKHKRKNSKERRRRSSLDNSSEENHAGEDRARYERHAEMVRSIVPF